MDKVLHFTQGDGIVTESKEEQIKELLKTFFLSVSEVIEIKKDRMSCAIISYIKL